MRRVARFFIALCGLTTVAAQPADIEWPATAAELGLMQGYPPPPAARVTLANWQFAPHNRWAFQNVREVLPTATVATGGESSRPFANALVDIEALTFSHDGHRLTVRDMLAASYTDGIAVLHRGALVHERYFNGLTPQRPHLLWSVSKSVLGLLAGILVEEGLLDVERALDEYVPQLADSGWAGNRVRDVLDMKTTSEWIEDYDDPASSVRRQDASNGLLPLPPEFGDLPRGNYFFLPTVGRDAARAGRFVYKSGDTDVAAWAMERAAGTRLAELLSDRLWSKIGAEADAYYTIDPSGSVLASGGLNATLRDIARIGQLVLDDGKVGERQIVPRVWLRDIAGEKNAAAWQRGAGGSEAGGYRSFWWHTGNANGALYAHGVHGQWIYVDPTAEVVIAKVSSHPEAASSGDDRLTLAGFRAIVAALERLP